MLIKSIKVLAAIAACVLGQSLNPAAYHASDIIRQDYAIIGGGASGTYAAIALKDQQKSFVVVEKTGRLGGHARTYLDPQTGGAVDFGVQIYENTSVVRDFFTRLNAPFKPVAFSQFGDPTIYADFANKKLLPNYNPGAVGEDYLTLLNKYNPGADDLTFLKTPIDPDLTLKWTDFITKTNLSNSSAYAAFNRPAVPGRLRDDLALYVFNDLNDVMLREYQQYGALVNANRDNSQMFRNAQAELGSSVLYNSCVVAASRATNNISIAVKTPTGYKLILAKQLIIAFPPTKSNMAPFGPDSNESSLISQIQGGHYYGGVVNNTGLEQSAAYQNRGAHTAWNVADIPSVVTIEPSAVDGLHYYWYNSVNATKQSTIQNAVLQAISTLQTLTNATRTTPNFVDYQDFTPLQLKVSAQAIKDGFYQDFVALQGGRGTWYISSLFVVGSSQLFNNTLHAIPKIIAAAET